jgi:YD repeat-containing protein
MKHTLIFLLTATLVVTAGCKKENKKSAPAVLKSVTNSGSGVTTSYSYDGNGRATEIANSNGTKTTITYTGDTVTEVYSEAGNVVSVKAILLSNGLAVSSITTNGSGTITGFTDYTFDGNGFLVAEVNYDANHQYINRKEYAINDGDIKIWTNRDTLVNENNFEYYYDHYYIEQKNTIGNNNRGLTYYGKNSGRLTKISTRYNYYLGNLRYSHGYTFDEYNRVFTEKVYDHHGVLKYTNTYTYY